MPTKAEQILKVWIHGVSGRMGEALLHAIKASPKQATLAGSSARHGLEVEGRTRSVATGENLADAMQASGADVVLDFSTPDGNQMLWATLNGGSVRLPVLIGTTGLASKQLSAWKSLGADRPMPILYAPNTSIGILALSRALPVVAKALAQPEYDVTVVETHHRNKRDAPSGTAVALVDALARVSPTLAGTQIHSLRGGGNFGEHEIRFLGQAEEFTLSHRALSRSLFATGALRLARWLIRQRPGYFTLDAVELDSL